MMTSKRSDKENNTTAVPYAVDDDGDDDISAEFEEEKEAEGDIDISIGNFNLEERERAEGDLVANHPSEETMVGNTGSGSGQLKEPEDERDYMKDTRDVHQEKTQDVHQNNIEEAADEKIAPCVRQDMQQKIQETTAIPQKGTIAEIPEQENNINAAHGHGQEVPEIIDNGESVVVPGIMFIAGPDYTGEGIHTGYESGDVEDETNIDEGGIVLQGFLPEDDPSRRSRGRSNVESLEERVQRLFDNAVTLDDSAVRPIPIEIEGHGDEENNGGLEALQINTSGEDDEAEKIDSSCSPWFLALWLLVIAGCIILAIALPISLRGNVENATADTQAPLSDAVCLPGSVDTRFELAKSILSSITSLDLLQDESTPQGKAIRWVVCEDFISVQFLGNQDPSTGNLPKQKHGFRLSGDAGEEQVIRRYILATVFYSTSQVSPWTDSLNFLSPDLHECNWHKNYTRRNFPFGDFDPVGVFCIIDKGELSAPIDIHDEFLLDDENYPLRYLELNLRIDNNLNGPLTPEFGYLSDLKTIGLENNIQLTGQLPQTMGNMSSLFSLTLILNGPTFGGELPSALFRLPNLKHIHFQDNLGDKWSLPSNVEIDDDAQLERFILSRNNFAGTIPTWLAQLNHLRTLDLSTNNFHGSIPAGIGNLSSLKYLNLMENNLTETIPSTLGKLAEIEVLVLGNNKLQGELPTAIRNLQTLKILDVGSNEMTSTIPSSFGNLESLKYLVLESNRFNGTVDVLESMKNLTVLLIRSNSFSGSLPEGLFSESFDNIAVDIGDNKFTGFLPSSFANMNNLVSLIGAKNSFADGATQTAVCDNNSLLLMDCNACECCEICCDRGDDLCDFQLDVGTLLGYDCGSWFAICLKEAEYYAGFGIY